MPTTDRSPLPAFARPLLVTILAVCACPLLTSCQLIAGPVGDQPPERPGTWWFGGAVIHIDAPRLLFDGKVIDWGGKFGPALSVEFVTADGKPIDAKPADGKVFLRVTRSPKSTFLQVDFQFDPASSASAPSVFMSPLDKEAMTPVEFSRKLPDKIVVVAMPTSGEYSQTSDVLTK